MNHPRRREAFGSPEHNGNQTLVLRAIQRGNQQVSDVVRVTGLDALAVRNAIKRLQDAGEIRRKDLGGYAPVIRNCLLAELWR